MHVKMDVPAGRLIRMVVLLLSFAACCYFTAGAQINQSYAHASLAEKIYIQLDSKVYTNDNTVWFKAIVTDATDHAPSRLSGVLWVELVGPGETIIEQKRIKLLNGTGDGFFQLNPAYTAGVYLVRAYTEWNKNFGADFFFTEYITLFAATPAIKATAIRNVTLVKGQLNERRLTAFLDPFVIDSLHSKDLTLVVSVDEQKDTIAIKKNSRNLYLLDYPIPPTCQLVTLQVQTKNHFSDAKTIVLDTSWLDLQFFPESGELVHGLPALVAFKALDCNGVGKLLEGEIVNEQGAVLASFTGNSAGMGSVELPVMDSSVKLFARLLPLPAGGQKKLYPLPAVVPKGNALSVKKADNQIQVKAVSNYLATDSVTVRVTCRGLIYYDIKGVLKNGRLSFSLPTDQFPEGILCFTMLADSMHPVAERLYFNQRPDNRIRIALSTDQPSYTQRDGTKLSIETTDHEGRPVSANVSVLVVNKEQLGQLQDRRQNILSFFLLSSDLKGTIENPGWYFRNNENQDADLDALLLTQGWRKYLYTKPPGKILFQPETNVTVSGSVGGLIFTKKMQKGNRLTMMTFGPNPSFQTQLTDSLGRFKFLLPDEYGDHLNILLQSANKSGVKKDYTLTLDKKEPPAISFNQVKTVVPPDSVIHALVEKNRKRKKLLDAQQLASGKMLDEVILKSYRMTPERKKVADEYGKPAQVIEGQAIRDKEAKWSYGLYSVLMFNFPGQVAVNRATDGTLYARLHNSEITLVVIDGVPVLENQYPLIPNIPPSEVSSFELIPYAKNFLHLYCTVFPMGCATAPAWGNVIAIYTYGKKGIFGANRAEGIMKTAVPVLSTTREFYAPKYDQLKPADWDNPDLRALIHWQPILKTDSLGKAATQFYNADNMGAMQVVVEAIADDGRIGYAEMVYEVKLNTLLRNPGAKRSAD